MLTVCLRCDQSLLPKATILGYRPFEAHDRLSAVFRQKQHTRRLAQPLRGDSWKSEEKSAYRSGARGGTPLGLRRSDRLSMKGQWPARDVKEPGLWRATRKEPICY